VLRRTLHVGEIQQSMTGAKETIAVIITSGKSNRRLPDRQAGAYRSSKKKTTLDINDL
jgi:hypothetical protein